MNTASEQLSPPPLPLDSETESGAGVVETTTELVIESSAATSSSIAWPKLTTLLRWLGAVTLLASAMTFLVSNWMETDQVLRYAQFLGFTVLLSGCGWFCINRWKDDKGARTFFALGTALLPANFAMMGAMIYASRRGAESFNGFREAFQFVALDLPTLLGTIAVALAFLVPLTYLGFAAMARKQAKLLTGVFLLANATLLFTVRDATWVAIIGFAMLAGLIWVDRRYFAVQSRLRTWDGVAMRSLLFAPFGLLVGRNLMLHGGESELLISLLCTTLACVFYIGIPRCAKEASLQALARIVALVPAFAAWVYFTESVGLTFRNWEVPFQVMPCALIAAVLSLKMGTMARSVLNLSVATLISGGLWQLFVHTSAASSVLVVAVSLATILVGFSMRERWAFRFGLVGMGIGLLYQLRFAAELYQGEWLWISLGATGVIVLLSASYLERYGRRGLETVRALHRKVSAW